MSNRQYAEILRNVVSATTPDLILTGVQANDDLDGQLATWLAGLLDYPFVTVVAEVEAKDTQVLVKKSSPEALRHRSPFALRLCSASKCLQHLPVTPPSPGFGK